MNYSEDDYLLLSGIQHFSFCRRQWGLIHIEQVWKENELTAGGRIVHERVHNKSLSESRNEELIIRGMPVKSSVLGISGECDAVVFRKADNGVTLHGREGIWSVLPVEYKRGSSKTNDCDRLQVAAQTMCLEEMFCCQIKQAALYYHETRNREYIEITDELRERVKESFADMHDMYRRGYTPKVKPDRKCESCSLKELCVPKLMKKKSVAQYVKSHIDELPI